MCENYDYENKRIPGPVDSFSMLDFASAFFFATVHHFYQIYIQINFIASLRCDVDYSIYHFITWIYW